MVNRSIPATALARLIEQASRALHSLGFQRDLFPAQWTAMRYFASADPQHRTASALARFQGIAVGPVTRTVRTLIAKGLLQNVEGKGRGRARRIELTSAGEELLTHDPLDVVVQAVEELAPTERQALASALERVLRRIQAEHRGAS